MTQQSNSPFDINRPAGSGSSDPHRDPVLQTESNRTLLISIGFSGLLVAAGYVIGGAFLPLLLGTLSVVAIMRGFWPRLFARHYEGSIIQGIPYHRKESLLNWVIFLASCVVLSWSGALLYRRYVPTEPDIVTTIKNSVRDAVHNEPSTKERTQNTPMEDKAKVEDHSAPSNIPSVPRETRQFPVVVKFHIGWKGATIFQNEGKARLDDLSLVWGRFTFDKVAFRSGRGIVVSESNFPGGRLVMAHELKSGQSVTRNLDKIMPFQGDISELPGDDTALVPFPEFGLRLSFRDSQTGQKYACYKVLSAILGLPEPWGDDVAVGGPASATSWEWQINKTVLAQTQEHFENDGALVMQCDH